MTACKYKLKDEQYNYPLQWVAVLFWLTEVIDRNRSVTIVRIKARTGQKKGLSSAQFDVFMFNLRLKLSRRTKLNVKIPIDHRHPLNHTEATAVSSLRLYSTPA